MLVDFIKIRQIKYLPKLKKMTIHMDTILEILNQ